MQRQRRSIISERGSDLNLVFAQTVPIGLLEETYKNKLFNTTSDHGALRKRNQTQILKSFDGMDDVNLSLEKNGSMMKAKKLSFKKESIKRNKKKDQKMPIKRSSKRFSGMSKSKSSSNFGKIESKGRLRNASKSVKSKKSKKSASRKPVKKFFKQKNSRSRSKSGRKQSFMEKISRSPNRKAKKGKSTKKRTLKKSKTPKKKKGSKSIKKSSNLKKKTKIVKRNGRKYVEKVEEKKVKKKIVKASNKLPLKSKKKKKIKISRKAGSRKNKSSLILSEVGQSGDLGNVKSGSSKTRSRSYLEGKLRSSGSQAGVVSNGKVQTNQENSINEERNNTSIHKEAMHIPEEPSNLPRKSQVVITRNANGGIKNIEVVTLPDSMGSSELNPISQIVEPNPGGRPTIISDVNIESAGKLFAKTDKVEKAQVEQIEEMTQAANNQIPMVMAKQKVFPDHMMIKKHNPRSLTKKASTETLFKIAKIGNIHMKHQSFNDVGKQNLSFDATTVMGLRNPIPEELNNISQNSIRRETGDSDRGILERESERRLFGNDDRRILNGELDKKSSFDPTGKQRADQILKFNGGHVRSKGGTIVNRVLAPSMRVTKPSGGYLNASYQDRESNLAEVQEEILESTNTWLQDSSARRTAQTIKTKHSKSRKLTDDSQPVINLPDSDEFGTDEDRFENCPEDQIEQRLQDTMNVIGKKNQKNSSVNRNKTFRQTMNNVTMNVGSQLGGIADDLEEFADKINITSEDDDNENQNSGYIDVILEEQDRPTYLKRLSADKILKNMDSSEIQKKNDLLGGMALEDLMTRRPTTKLPEGIKPTRFEFEDGEILDIPGESGNSEKMDLLESEKMKLKSFSQKKSRKILEIEKNAEKLEHRESLHSLNPQFVRPPQMSVEKRAFRSPQKLELRRPKEINESQMTRQINRGEEAKLKSHDVTKNSSFKVFQHNPMTPIKRPDQRLLKESANRSPVNPVYGKEMLKRYSRTISPLKNPQNLLPQNQNLAFRQQEQRQIKPSMSKSSQMVAKSVDYNLGRVPGKGHIYRRFVLSGERPDTSSLSPTHRKPMGRPQPLYTMSQKNFGNFRRGMNVRQPIHTMSHQGFLPGAPPRPSYNHMNQIAETRSMPGSPIPNGQRRFSPMESQHMRRIPELQTPRSQLGESYYLPRGMVRQASEILPKNRIWGSPVPNTHMRPMGHAAHNPKFRRNFNNGRPISPIRSQMNPMAHGLHRNMPRGPIKAPKFSHRKQANNQLPIRDLNVQKNRRGRQLPRYNPEAMAQITREPRPHSAMSVYLRPTTAVPFNQHQVLSENDLAHRLTNLFKKTLVYSSKIESLKKKILRQNPRFSAEPIFLVFASYPEHLSAEDLFMLFRAFKLKLAPVAVGKIMLYKTGHDVSKLLKKPEKIEVIRKNKTKKFTISPSGRLVSQKNTLTESEHFYAQNPNLYRDKMLNRSEEPVIIHPEDRIIPNEFGDSKRFLNFSDFRFLLESEREEDREPQSNFNLSDDLYIKEIDYHIIRQILILLTRKIKDMGSIIRGIRPYGIQRIFEYLQNFSGSFSKPEVETPKFQDPNNLSNSKKSRKPYLENMQPQYSPEDFDLPRDHEIQGNEATKRRQRKLQEKRKSRKDRDFYIDAEEEPADDEDFELNGEIPMESYYRKAKRQIHDPRDQPNAYGNARNQLKFEKTQNPYIQNQILDDGMLNEYPGQANEMVLTLISFERFLEEREIQFVSEDLRLVMSSFGSNQEWIDLDSLANFIQSPVWDL